MGGLLSDPSFSLTPIVLGSSDWGHKHKYMLWWRQCSVLLISSVVKSRPQCLSVGTDISLRFGLHIDLHAHDMFDISVCQHFLLIT